MNVLIWLIYFGLMAPLVLITLRGKTVSSARHVLLAYGIVIGVVSLITSYQANDPAGNYGVTLWGSDGEGYFAQAQVISDLPFSDGFTSIISNYVGYQVILGNLFRVFGAHLAIGLAANALMVVLSGIVLYHSVRISAGDRRTSVLAVYLFIAYTPIVYFSAVLLKEPYIVFGMSLLIFGVAKINQARRIGILPLGVLIISCVIFASMRIPYLAVVPLTILVGAGSGYYRRLMLVSVVVAGIVFSWGTFAALSTHSFSTEWLTDTANSKSNVAYVKEQGASTSGVVLSLIGNYDGWAPWQRVAALPVTVGIQYSMPIVFWDWTTAVTSIPTVFGKNLTVLWLFGTGPLLLFSIKQWFQVERSFASQLFWIGCLMYCVVAYIYGGMIPRYAAPFLLLTFPFSAEVWRRLETRNAHGQDFSRFYFRYCTAGSLLGLLYLFRTATAVN